jgi:hypothetical protein
VVVVWWCDCVCVRTLITKYTGKATPLLCTFVRKSLAQPATSVGSSGAFKISCSNVQCTPMAHLPFFLTFTACLTWFRKVSGNSTLFALIASEIPRSSAGMGVA